MGLGIYIIIFVLCYYTVNIAKISFSPVYRVKLRSKNKSLDTLRVVPIKSVEQQKEFLNLKYPKNRFSKKHIFPIIVDIICFIFLFRAFRSGFALIDFDPSITSTLVFAMIFPLVINWGLSKFNVEGNSVFSLFKKVK